MQIDIIVHGIPTGQDFSVSNPPIYLQNFYNRSKGVNCFFAEIRNDNNQSATYYTLFISRNVANYGNRPGAYFAISLKIDGCYCTNVQAIYSALMASFRSSFVGSLIEKQGDGFRFVKAGIGNMSEEIDKIATALFQQLRDSLEANQIPLDSSFRLGGSLQAYNPTDLNDEQILAVVKENGAIMLSDEQPSIEQKKRIEELEAQRKREAEEAQRRILLERQRLIEEKNAAIETERKKSANEIALLQKSIAAKDETLRTYNQEYQQLANQLSSANNSIAETRRTVNDLGAKLQQLAATSRPGSNPNPSPNPAPGPTPPRKNNVKPFIVVGGIFSLLLIIVLLINRPGAGTLNPNDLNALVAKVDALGNQVKQNQQMITLYHSGYNPIPETETYTPPMVKETDNPPIETADDSQLQTLSDADFYSALYPDVTNNLISLKIRVTRQSNNAIKQRFANMLDGSVSWKIYNENGDEIQSGKGKIGPTLTQPGNYQAVFIVDGAEIKRDPDKRIIEIKN